MFKYLICTVLLAVKHFNKVTSFYCSQIHIQFPIARKQFPIPKWKWSLYTSPVKCFCLLWHPLWLKFLLFHLVWIDIGTCDNNEQGLTSHTFIFSVNAGFAFKFDFFLSRILNWLEIPATWKWNPSVMWISFTNRLTVTCVINEQKMKRKKKRYDGEKWEREKDRERDDDDYFFY